MVFSSPSSPSFCKKMNFSKVRGGREINKKHQTIFSKNKETKPQLFDISPQKRRKNIIISFDKYFYKDNIMINKLLLPLETEKYKE